MSRRRRNFDLSMFQSPGVPEEGLPWWLPEQRSEQPAVATNGNGEQSVESSEVVITRIEEQAFTEEEFETVLEGVNGDGVFDETNLQIVLPRSSRGRKTRQDAHRYDADLETFCRQIVQIDSRLDFRVSARGWCYLLEPHELGKGEFDYAERLINNCRRSGQLPSNICAEDEGRSADNLEKLDPDVAEEAQRAVKILLTWQESYQPISLWEDQPYYVQMVVEKIDLKSLFSPICAKYHIPCINASGWNDINSRIRMAERFKYWEDRGKICVLLNCGDFDAGGLNISSFLTENFRQLEKATGWDPGLLDIDRFGLSYKFILENGLTWIDNLRTAKKDEPNDLGDPRHPDHNKDYVQSYIRQFCPDFNPHSTTKDFGVRKCEANALVVRPDEGRQLCLDAILKYIDTAGIEHWEAETNDKRDELKSEIARELRNIIQ
jgi:hypothetical protein